MQALSSTQLQALADQAKATALALGFQQAGITDTDLSGASARLQQWLAAGYHGQMHFMAAHGSKRYRPEQLVENTCRVLSVRLDYLPESHQDSQAQLAEPEQAFISRYALGRDYHKLMRKRLQTLATRLTEQFGPFGYRVFVDSAPVLEKPLAQKAGLGWIGKHSNLINRQAGSWFFLGEIYLDIPLPIDPPERSDHCGQCRRCIDVCPTQAIVAPYVVDARRCVSYLTIELKESIPEPLRALIGNRIYGCDDCQLYCPWNRFAKLSAEEDFQARHQLDRATLLTLLAWDEETFLQKTEGSAIRRIGHERWLRNVAVAVGNALRDASKKEDQEFIQAAERLLMARCMHPSTLVKEHARWALDQLTPN